MKSIIAVIIAVLTSISLNAQIESDTSKSFSLMYLIENALKKNTKLEPIEFQRKIELIKKEQVNKQPVPMLEAMIDYIPVNFMNKPEYSTYYSQRLILPEKLRTNELISNVNVKRQEIIKEKVNIDIIRQIKTNYYNLYYYERLLEFNLEYQMIIKNIIKSLESGYSSGMGVQNQILKMSNELQMLDFEKIELEAARKVYLNSLRVITNLDIPDEFHTKDIQPVLNSFLPLDSTKLTEIMIKNNPEFKMIDNMLEETRIEKNLADLDKIPDITLRSGYKYMAKEPMGYFNISVGIDLTFMPWNVKRRNAMIEEKTAMEHQTNAIRNSSLQYMKNELQNMIIMINSLKDKLKYLNEILVPQTEQTFNSTLVSYSAGASEFMNMLDAYRRLRESVQMRAKEETELLKQYGELEFLLGKSIIEIN